MIPDIIKHIEKTFKVKLSEENKHIITNKVRSYKHKYDKLRAKRIKIDKDALLDGCNEDILIDQCNMDLTRRRRLHHLQLH